VSSKGQEIELAVQNLEDEMMNSQQQLTALEDSLANRYVACVCMCVCVYVFVSVLVSSSHLLSLLMRIDIGVELDRRCKN